MEPLNKTSRARQVTITVIVFLVFLSVPISVGLMYHNTGSALKQQISSQLKDEEDLAAAAIAVRLNHLTEIASSLAGSPQLISFATNGKWNNAASFARDAQNNTSFYDPYIDRIVFFDKSGMEQAAYPMLSGGIGTSIANVDWYRTAMQTRNVTVSEVVKRQATPSFDIVNIVAPIQEGRTIVGLLDLQIPTANFLDFNYALSTGTYGFTYIVDQKGNIVAHPKYSGSDVVNLASVSPVTEILTGQSGTISINSSNENQDDFLVYGPVPNYNWGVVIQEPYDEAFAAYDTLINTMTIAESLLLAIDLLLSYLVFRFIGSKRADIQARP
jgi:hypothetical protein